MNGAISQLNLLLGIFVAVTVLIGSGFGAVRWLRGWIRAQVVQPLSATKNHTAHSASTLATLAESVQHLSTLTQENRDLALAANILARQAHERLDNHLTHEHGKEKVDAGKSF